MAVSNREPLLTAGFVSLFVFTLVAFISALQLFPVIPFRIMALGYSKAQAGLFLGLYTYASAIAAPIMGSVADHFGRRRLLLVAATAFIFFSLLYGAVERLPILLVVAGLHGVFWSGLLSSSAAIVSEIIPASRRTEGLAYWGMAPTAAIALAPSLGIFVYELGWWTLCLEMAMLSALLLLMGLRLKGGTEGSRHPFPSLWRVVDWRVLVTALTLFVITYGYGGITSYVALAASERQAGPPALFFAVMAISMLATRIIVSPLGDRLGPERLLYPCLAVVPFSLGLLAVAGSMWPIAAAAVLFGIGIGGAYPSFVTWVLGRTDPLRRAATFGAIFFAFDTGIGSGSMLTGYLVDGFGYLRAFGTAAVVSTAAIPVFLLSSRLFDAGKRGTSELTGEG